MVALESSASLQSEISLVQPGGRGGHQKWKPSVAGIFEKDNGSYAGRKNQGNQNNPENGRKFFTGIPLVQMRENQPGKIIYQNNIFPIKSHNHVWRHHGRTSPGTGDNKPSIYLYRSAAVGWFH